MRVLWMLTICMVAGAATRTGNNSPEAKPIVAVCATSSAVVPYQTLWRAQAAAARVLAQVGVRLHWQCENQGLSGHKAVRGGEPREMIRVHVDATAPADVQAEALGYATAVKASGTSIHLFYDRIEVALAPEFTSAILGHALAHEIVHVLEGVSRHSADGLMKAHWSHSDYREMLGRPLPFAAEDEELIRRHFAVRPPHKELSIPTRFWCACYNPLY